MKSTGGTVESFPAPSATRGWLLVTILVAAYAVSFVDRQILSLLVGDLRHDLHIDDTQIGLLQGPAFGLFYALLGMPLGWLADRVDRMRLIAAGLLTWTLMTVLSGLANSFATLFAARMGVGIGEAALVPAAVSLIADSFPPSRRPLPLAIFTGGISVGVGLSLVLGGALIAYARSGAAGQLPVLGAFLAGRSAWQIVLILAGLAGVPLGLLILCISGPPHRRDESVATPESMGLLAWLQAERAIFMPLLAGSSLLYLFTNALAAWMPTLFIREFHWAPAAVGVNMGAVILAGALSGNVISGFAANRLLRRGLAGATARVMASGAGLLAPVAIFGPLLPDAELVRTAVGLIYFAMAICFGVATGAIVAVTPSAIRGRMVALYLLLGNFVGLVLGPPSVGLILDHGMANPAHVGTALAIIALLTTVPGFWLIFRALEPHGRRAAALPD